MAIETLGDALRQINRLFADGVVTGLSDSQLLERFVGQRDATSFEALVARHGPMVLSVCRGILRDPNDAEDAFQATFLILVKKAGAIRGRVVLGGWLYQVAHRVAIQANIAAARRRAREREAGQMTTVSASSSPAVWYDLLPSLHEEIARLPEKYRLPILLCDLEGLPQAQAAGQLHWSERTLRRRLAEARDRLKSRLARRGLAPDDVMLGAMFLREARAAVPAVWQEATVRAALDLVNHTLTAGAVSAAAGSLAREVLKIMLVQKLKLATVALLSAGLMTWVATAALISRGDEPQKPAPAPVARRATPSAAAQPEPDPLDAVGTFPVAGRVLDPDGKLVARAEIYVHPFSFDVMASATSNTVPAYQSGRVATSDAEGRFHFELDKASSDFPYRDFPAWHGAQIAAVAPGCGPAWVDAGSLLKGGEVTLRLVRDDVPIRGRVLDSQGRPVSGVTVRAHEIRVAGEQVDRDALLASGAIDFGQTASQYSGPTWLGKQGAWTTDGDGRFEVRGVGRDRIVGLEFQSPVLAKAFLYAMARASQVPTKPHPWPSRPPGRMKPGRPPDPRLVGATFEEIVGPTKPITGVVRLKGTGKPLAGVQIVGAEPATWTEVWAETDAQGRFQLFGLPKGTSYEVRAAPRPGIDPFLGASMTVTDTEGLKRIETTLELPKGIIVTGRMIDTATGRLVRAKHVSHLKVPVNHNEGHADLSHSGLVDPIFRITVPPGEGMIYANVRGTNLPYTRARLKKADKGKGIGGIGDGETTTMRLDAYHTYKMIDVPADAESIAVDLELTRGETRRGRLVGPTGKQVIGAQCAGHSDAWAEVKTLADDTFEVFGLMAGHPREVIFGHKELGLVGWVVVKEEDSQTDAPLVVHLQRAGSIKGRLVDEDGSPMGGVRLGVRTHYPDVQGFGPPRQGLWPDDATYTSDADGRFLIDGLRPGLKSSIHLQTKTRPGFRLDTGDVFREIVSQPGEIRDVGDVRVRAETE
ncbi:MAG: sigma-70 family RNA polymerase sigma factor [Isosphaerales bacterium]